MSRRIIPCQITDEYVRGDGAVVGAAGSHNDVALRLEFSPMWAGTARSIVWRDALGGNPTVTLLGVNLLETGKTETYIVPIPAEPKAHPGEISMTIKGVLVDGDKEISATLTARARFVVLENAWDEDAQQSGDITPTQVEQFQAQMELLKESIVDVIPAAEEAKQAAEVTAANADRASAAAELAQALALESDGNATRAYQSAMSAMGYMDTAELYAQNAEESFLNAKAKEDEAYNDALYAAQSAQKAEQEAEAAKTAADSVSGLENAAAASAAQAKASENSAADSKAAALLSEQNAERWAKEAKEIAGADFMTKTETETILATMQPWYKGVDLTEKFADEIAKFDSPWAWIQARIRAGNYDGLRICDYIPFKRTNNGQRLEAQIAGIDTYYDYGENGSEVGHHIDFITRETVGWGRRINAINFNNGTDENCHAWLASELYLVLNGLQGYCVSSLTYTGTIVRPVKHEVVYSGKGMWDWLPKDLQDCIVEKQLKLEQRCIDGALLTKDNSVGWTNIGKLWVPTEIEVYGHGVSNKSIQATGSSVQYPIFMGNCNRVKRRPNGTRATWWLLNPSSGTHEYWCCVSGKGNADSTYTTSAYEFPVCFRIA